MYRIPINRGVKQVDMKEWLSLIRVDPGLSKEFHTRTEQIEYIKMIVGDRYEKSHMFYLAGPYNACGGFTIEENISEMRRKAKKLWRLKIPVMCPHMNTGMFPGDDTIYTQAYEDCLFRFSGLIYESRWQLSSGTKKEIKICTDLKIPIYYYNDVLLDDWTVHNRRFT